MPPDTSERSTTTTAALVGPPTTVAAQLVSLPDLFGAEATTAIGELQSLGLAVIAYDVCSGSVGAGEVRQIVYPDGTELVGSDGTTTAGSSVPIGSSVEVKIGTGTPCD
jgi:hypothetical protein